MEQNNSVKKEDIPVKLAVSNDSAGDKSTTHDEDTSKDLIDVDAGYSSDTETDDTDLQILGVSVPDKPCPQHHGEGSQIEIIHLLCLHIYIRDAGNICRALHENTSRL